MSGACSWNRPAQKRLQVKTLDCNPRELYEGGMRRRRTSTVKKDKPLPKGMKLNCPGRHSTDDVLAIFLNAVRELKARNIKHVSGLNIYLTPVDQHGRALTHFPDGKKIPGSIVTVDGPYRSAADELGL